jgi:raffinose/stachyose/melibiose transport system substrate-binding protein
MPPIDGKKPVMSVFAEDTIMIHAKSPNKDEAAEFVNWMISKPAMTKKLGSTSRSLFDRGRSVAPVEMEQRLGKAMAGAGSFTFMHVDHARRPRSRTSSSTVAGRAGRRDDA